jgi:DNA-binding NarL/FixJ family response regulator
VTVLAHTYVPAPRPSAEAPGYFSALVVAADPAARKSVVSFLDDLGPADVLEAASAGEARVRSRGAPRHLVVVDLDLPDGSALGLLEEFRAVGWPRAMALSSSDDPYVVRAALRAGVRSFLVWGSGSPGGPPDGTAAGGRFDGLSEREVEVLQLVADGNSNRDIGVALSLSALTVKSHLARIGRKLGTGDRAEMVAVALRAGVIR